MNKPEEIQDERTVDKVIRLLGEGHLSRAALRLGKYPSQMVGWRRRGYIPAQFALLVEDRTKGAISAREVMLDAAKYGK